MTTKKFVYTPIASLLVLAFTAPSVMSAQQHDIKKAKTAQEQDAVMVVTAPATSPLEVVTSPKTPRQPVPASDGADYLKTIPGFSQVRNGGTNGDPVFRGMFGSRLRVLTDKGEMLGACPNRMDAPTSYISPESFDLLTLVKGPQTVLWGGGNSAGTIRFERETPRFEKAGIKGNASVLAASHHRWDENSDVTVGNETGYLRMLGNHSKASDYKDGEGMRVPSQWKKWNADVALGWTPDGDTLLELSGGKGDGEARYAGRKMDGSQFKRDSLAVRFEKSNIGEHFDRFEASAYYNYADHVMDNFSLRSPTSGGGHTMPGMSHPMPMAMQLDRKTQGARMMGTWLLGNVELKGGTDLQTNTHRRQSQGIWSKDAHFRDYGLFSELSWALNDQNKLVGGARLNRMQVDKYSEVGTDKREATLPAGFVRLEQTLGEGAVMWYAGVGYTERFPDYWELFSPTFGADHKTSAFHQLKTEKTTQIDVGAHYHGEQLSGWASAYVGRVNDFILFRYNPMHPRISQAENVDATTLGGELGLSYQWTEAWKSDVSLAYSWAKNTRDHRPLPQTPPLETRLGLTWEQGDWSSSGLLRLVSAQHRVSLSEGNVTGKDFATSSGFAVISANMAYRISPAVKLSTGVDNLFNTTYSEHLNLAGNSSFGYSADIPVNEPGRTFWAKINVTF